MNLPEGMTLFVPQTPDDMKLLRVGDTIRLIEYYHKGKSYEHKRISDCKYDVRAIDQKYCSILFGFFEIEMQFHYGQEYIIDRMNVRQQIKYLLRGPKL